MILAVLAAEKVLDPSLDVLEWPNGINFVVLDRVDVGVHRERMEHGPQSAGVSTEHW